jgi:hypothetical protein
MGRSAIPGRVAEGRSAIGNGDSKHQIIGLQPESDPTILLGLAVANGIANELRDHEDEVVCSLRREAAAH